MADSNPIAAPAASGIYEDNPWEAVSDADLGPFGRIPTTLTKKEKQLFYWLGAHAIPTTGAIVDLGSFVGCSAACLAHGAAQRSAKSARTPDLHVFDRFDIQEATKPALLYDQGVAPFEGLDILWLAKENLAPFEGQITYHIGNIRDARWAPTKAKASKGSGGGKIAVLNMDASKDLDATDQMAEDFWPHLIAGKSLVIQPDFLHWRQPWVSIQMELFSNFFEPVAAAPADTLVFRCIKVPTLTELRDHRVSYLPHRTRIQYAKDARDRVRNFDRVDKMAQVINATRSNPGVSLAWKMKAP